MIKRQFGYTKVRFRSVVKTPPAGHTVCVVAPVDGAQTVNDCRRGARVMLGMKPAKRSSQGKNMHLKVKSGLVFDCGDIFES
ncbi:hypothetical protein [Pseudomonas sp. CC6-YY-74]|uniref:hypothetical protein n=1 Tax=Pseudomonas sp. CC6-YY-74 TaxID=1930532 RepID=UPI0012AB7AB4|nr:hypothetical protein [Pseudomonas sp. CC6-YY-74]